MSTLLTNIFSGAYNFSGIMISFTCPSEAEAYLDGRGRVADEFVDKEQVEIASCLYINVLVFYSPASLPRAFCRDDTTTGEKLQDCRRCDSRIVFSLFIKHVVCIDVSCVFVN